MITPAQNEMLTRVGRATPMGKFMRQFWIPACLSSELVADGPQMRLMLLGERLIAFRDTGGRVGIMDHRCPHRLASLFLGRNEHHGIRCAYHGWKFDVDGNCLDQPNLPDKTRYPAGIKATAYKTAESGGLIFVYMGERASAPGLPQIEPIMAEPDDRNIALTQRDCNWLQALEGDITSGLSAWRAHRRFANGPKRCGDLHSDEQVSPHQHQRDALWHHVLRLARGHGRARASSLCQLHFPVLGDLSQRSA
jgi:phthalate 4,5-dioxygenase oxygenase subunit